MNWKPYAESERRHTRKNEAFYDLRDGFLSRSKYRQGVPWLFHLLLFQLQQEISDNVNDNATIFDENSWAHLCNDTDETRSILSALWFRVSVHLTMGGLKL